MKNWLACPNKLVRHGTKFYACLNALELYWIFAHSIIFRSNISMLGKRLSEILTVQWFKNWVAKNKKRPQNKLTMDDTDSDNSSVHNMILINIYFSIFMSQVSRRIYRKSLSNRLLIFDSMRVCYKFWIDSKTGKFDKLQSINSRM